MNGQEPLVFVRDIQKVDGSGQCAVFIVSVSRVLGLLYRHYPSNPPNLPIREIFSETVIPGFKVIMAEGLRQGQSWKWNTGVLNPLPKL